MSEHQQAAEPGPTRTLSGIRAAARRSYAPAEAMSRAQGVNLQAAPAQWPVHTGGGLEGAVDRPPSRLHMMVTHAEDQNARLSNQLATLERILDELGAMAPQQGASNKAMVPTAPHLLGRLEASLAHRDELASALDDLLGRLASAAG